MPYEKGMRVDWSNWHLHECRDCGAEYLCSNRYLDPQDDCCQPDDCGGHR